MNLPEDPVILLSVINTRLRDSYSSLDELCYDYNIKRENIEIKLGKIGYTYNESQNQFK